MEERVTGERGRNGERREKFTGERREKFTRNKKRNRGKINKK